MGPPVRYIPKTHDYYRRFGYAMPYKWRFIVGLTFGVLFGIINSMLPLVMARVAGGTGHRDAR